MSGPAIKVKADDVASLFRKEIQDVVGKLRMVILKVCVEIDSRNLCKMFHHPWQRGITPLLVGFLANGDIAAKKYAEVRLLFFFLLS